MLVIQTLVEDKRGLGIGRRKEVKQWSEYRIICGYDIWKNVGFIMVSIQLVGTIQLYKSGASVCLPQSPVRPACFHLSFKIFLVI